MSLILAFLIGLVVGAVITIIVASVFVSESDRKWRLPWSN